MTPETHYQPQGAAQPACRYCGATFKPGRSWAAYCSAKCRNDFHGMERREAKMREAAPDLYEALLGCVAKMAEVCGPETASLVRAREALAKAGYREPRQA